MKELSGVVSWNRLLRMSLIGCVLVVPSGVSVWAQDADQVTAADVANEHLKFTRVNPKATGLNGTQQATLPGIPGVDSVPNFSGAYSTPGFGPTGQPQSNWLFNTLGKQPRLGGTTTLNAPVVPVSLDLRNADGSARFVRVVNGKAITCGIPIEPGCKPLFFHAEPFIGPALESPVLTNANYTSSKVPTQFADAVARAEYQGAPEDWHTLLAPTVKPTQTMVINQDPTCGIGQGKG